MTASLCSPQHDCTTRPASHGIPHNDRRKCRIFTTHNTKSMRVVLLGGQKMTTLCLPHQDTSSETTPSLQRKNIAKHKIHKHKEKYEEKKTKRKVQQRSRVVHSTATKVRMGTMAPVHPLVAKAGFVQLERLYTF